LLFFCNIFVYNWSAIFNFELFYLFLNSCAFLSMIINWLAFLECRVNANGFDRMNFSWVVIFCWWMLWPGRESNPGLLGLFDRWSCQYHFAVVNCCKVFLKSNQFKIRAVNQWMSMLNKGTFEFYLSQKNGLLKPFCKLFTKEKFQFDCDSLQKKYLKSNFKNC